MAKPTRDAVSPAIVKKALDAALVRQAKARAALPPIVVLDGEIGEGARTSLEALRDHAPNVFAHQGVLVEICKGESGTEFAPLGLNRLRSILSDCVAYYAPTLKPDPRTQGYYTHIDPPVKVCAAVLEDPNLDGIRKVDMVFAAPTMARDGTIINEPGYHPAERAYLTATVPMEPIGEPTREDAIAAYERLEAELFAEFSYTEDCAAFGSATLISALLAIVGAPGLGLKAPALFVSALDQDSGKSTAVQFLANVATGADFTPTTLPSTRDARDAAEKLTVRVESAVSCGRAQIFLDNWPNAMPFGDANIALSIVSKTREIRPYGQNDRTKQVADRLLWFVTGNNFTMAREADLQRRVLLLQLVPRPGHAFKLGDTEAALTWIRANRPALLRDCLTILKAHVLHGMQDMKHKPFNSFSEWDTYIRSAILWIGKPDPLLANQYARRHYMETTEGNLIRFLKEWWAMWGNKEITLRQLIDVGENATPDRKRAANYILSTVQAYYAGAIILDKGRNVPVDLDAHKLGMSLEKYHARPSGLGPFKLMKRAHKRGGKAVWQLELIGKLEDAKLEEEAEDVAPELPDNVRVLPVKEEVPY